MVCSTHSKNKRLRSHGCKRGEALLPLYLLACSLNSSSGGRVPSLKTNQISPFCLKTYYPYTLAISPDLWCTVNIAELLHLKSSLSDKIPLMWGPGPCMYSFYESVTDFQDWVASSSGPSLHFLVTLYGMDLFTYVPLSVDCEFLEARTITYSSFAI